MYFPYNHEYKIPLEINEVEEIYFREDKLKKIEIDYSESKKFIEDLKKIIDSSNCSDEYIYSVFFVKSLDKFKNDNYSIENIAYCIKQYYKHKDILNDSNDISIKEKKPKRSPVEFYYTEIFRKNFENLIESSNCSEDYIYAKLFSISLEKFKKDKYDIDNIIYLISQYYKHKDLPIDP